MTIAVSEISIGRRLLAHARALVERFGIERPLVIDDLAGTGYRLYGLLPNMTYLIGRGGRVLFRADRMSARAKTFAPVQPPVRLVVIEIAPSL